MTSADPLGQLSPSFLYLGSNVFVGVGVGSGEELVVGWGVGMGLGGAVGAGFGEAITTPLFQTNFFPDLTQVYVLPLETLVVPIFLQLALGFTSLNTGVETSRAIESVVAIARPNFTD